MTSPEAPVVDDLERRRMQMGQALSGWSGLPNAVHEVGADSWTFLSGLPSPDFNMVLLQRADRAELDALAARVAAADVPALLFCAGEAVSLADDLTSHWTFAGEVPFMAARVDAVPAERDARVRRAEVDDAEVVVDLCSRAYGLPADLFIPVVDAMLADEDHRLTAWLLEQDGTAVSTVTTGVVDDAITLWSMATPPEHARQGYARALLGDIMGRAAADGLTVGLLGSTPAGFPLYASSGWTTVEEWQVFVAGESAQFG